MLHEPTIATGELRPTYLEVDLERLAEADLAVVRLLGSPQEYAAELEAVRSAGRPVVVLGGEQTPSAELMEASTVPVGLAAEAHRYLAIAHKTLPHYVVDDFLTAMRFDPAGASLFREAAKRVARS